jgi:molybdate/tungstate transport system ATP-binding protein
MAVATLQAVWLSLIASIRLESSGCPRLAVVRAVSLIRVENLSVRVGSFSLESVSFEVGPRQYAVLMGRTGTGKTTLLESLCGLRKLTAGRIWLLGREVTSLSPAERGIGFVPQDGALFETMSVADHLGFALSIRRCGRREIERRAGELAELLGLRALMSRKPAGLSGGERQRVALGRALSARPGILCLDEPLSALDDATRDEMYVLLDSVRQHTGVTTLHITHNRSEAARLAQLLLLLENGKIRVADPYELQSEPRPSLPHRTAI